jgi:Anti-sigma-K factor rskA
MSFNDLPPPGPGAAPSASPDELARVEALLALPAAWIEPDATLEARVVAAIAQLTPAADEATAAVVALRPARRWRGRVVAALVGAAAASIAFVGIGLTHRAPSPNLRAALAPTAVLPAAGGKANLRETTSGWEIKLDTHDLPREKGRYYEAWLEGPKGTVSVGTFHTGGKVTLWAGVEADEYDTLVITIEQEDNNPAQSSDRVVLTAPLKR